MENMIMCNEYKNHVKNKCIFKKCQIFTIHMHIHKCIDCNAWTNYRFREMSWTEYHTIMKRVEWPSSAIAIERFKGYDKK